MNPATPAFVALGGNLDDVETTFAEAMWAIDGLPMTSIRRQSGIYRTPPWGMPKQPDFLNAVLELQTRLAPEILLERLFEIERNFGRDRASEQRWGPRVLDLDLLLYGDLVIARDQLQLPHPRLHQRAFVLVPLAEIAPELEIPGHGPVASLLAAVDANGIERLP